MKNNRPFPLRTPPAPPIPTRPQDEPLWIAFAGALSLAFLLYLAWFWM